MRAVEHDQTPDAEDQAEQRRRARLRRFATWGSAAAAVCLAGIATVAGFQWVAAEKSRKVAERERREKEIAAQEKNIAHHQKFVDRFRAKASKARQAQNKVRMIEKMADEIVPLAASSRRYPTFKFEERRHSGREVLKIKGVRKAFGDNQVLHGVDLLVNRGDVLAILGPNGIGKSTLLKIVMGDLEADAGEVEWGYETHPGYFAPRVAPKRAHRKFPG